MNIEVEGIEDLNDGSCRITFAMDWDTMAIFTKLGLENVLRKAVEEVHEDYEVIKDYGVISTEVTEE